MTQKHPNPASIFVDIENVADERDQASAVLVGDVDEMDGARRHVLVIAELIVSRALRTEVRGVRSSWLTIDTNSLFHLPDLDGVR